MPRTGAGRSVGSQRPPGRISAVVGGEKVPAQRIIVEQPIEQAIEVGLDDVVDDPAGLDHPLGIGAGAERGNGIADFDPPISIRRGRPVRSILRRCTGRPSRKTVFRVSAVCSTGAEAKRLLGVNEICCDELVRHHG